jgi:hypothetical protein
VHESLSISSYINTLYEVARIPGGWEPVTLLGDHGGPTNPVFPCEETQSFSVRLSAKAR